MKITEKKISEFVIEKATELYPIEPIFCYLCEHIGDKTERLKKFVTPETRQMLDIFETFCESKGD